jgi:hypothetical protein
LFFGCGFDWLTVKSCGGLGVVNPALTKEEHRIHNNARQLFKNFKVLNKRIFGACEMKFPAHSTTSTVSAGASSQQPSSPTLKFSEHSHELPALGADHPLFVPLEMPSQPIEIIRPDVDLADHELYFGVDSLLVKKLKADVDGLSATIRLIFQNNPQFVAEGAYELGALSSSASAPAAASALSLGGMPPGVGALPLPVAKS